MRSSFVDMLVCPETKQALHLGNPELLNRIHAAIQSGDLVNGQGKRFETPFSAVLVRSDGQRAYPVVEGIPVLLVGESLDLGDL